MKVLFFTSVLASILAGCGGGGGGATSPVVERVNGVPLPLYNEVKQKAVPIRTLNASADDDFADMAAFGAAIGDAQVVSLTEDTHGDANALELMNRQVQYLHKVKGFDVLMMESAMFDVEAIWRSASTKDAKIVDLAPDRIFFMYSKTDAGRKVLQYVDEQRGSARPLLLAGVDVPLGGATSIDEIVPALKAFLDKRGSGIPQQASWSVFAEVAQKAAALTAAGVNSKTFTSVAAQIRKEICSDPAAGATPRETAGWWCLQVKGLEADVARQATATLPIPDPRDQQMGENVLWAMDNLYSGKKVILWSNSGHGLIYREPCAYSGICRTPARSMAAFVRDRLESKLYVVKNTPKTGRVTDFSSTNATTEVYSFPDHITKTLDMLNYPISFVSPKIESTMVGLQFSVPTGVMYVFGPNGHMDGLFYYPLAVPAPFKQYPVTPLP
ncbi:hypothetical protein IGB42_03991 [Andreprevotia sp. IGB-42]|uniref:erythromycin esterase family protein n=1 Tax=Andreprevotia sp. IGB-42 TaxID=2497473 RepID=UPI00135732E9|nr:erythromycin esterase family protein [Andreprevotia sp. IGB-42]KAF0811534.1 hypothetical protein IGB42_03991 [Andreprevotia sp. IGB-42]